MVSTSKVDDGFDYIRTSGDLEDGWFHGGFTVFGDDNGWFRPVF
jgi:hypothetical protein